MTTPICFLTFTIISCMAGFIAGIRMGRRSAIGVAMATSLLSASWFQLTISDAPLSVHSCVAAIMMIAFCFHSGKQIWSPLNLLDFLMAGLVIWHVVCDSIQGGFEPLLPFRAYGEWALPYVTGRFAVMHRGAIAQLAPFFAIAGAVIGIAALCEAFTGTNVWEALFVEVDDVIKTNRGKRYDLFYRALGPTRHPIMLSVLLLMLIPWTIAWKESALDKRLKATAIGSFVAVVVGILSTISRGPVATGLSGVAFAGAVVNRTIRWVMIAVVCVGSVIVFLKFDDIITLLERTEGTRRSVVEYEDQQIVYSGTRNRLYVLQIYGPLIVRGGVFGFGTDATDSFPPNIPGLPTDPNSRQRLGVVDNAYINVGLRFGIVGMAILIAMLLVAIKVCVSLGPSASTYFYPAGPQFTLAMAAMLVAVGAEMLTVFFSYEYSFWFLLSLGVVSGMQVRVKLVSTGRED